MRREGRLALLGMFVSVCIVLLPIMIIMAYMLPYYMHPHRKVVINEEELQLIEKNNKALEDSIKKNCTEDDIYYLNELIPFEWDTVYFIHPYIKDNMNIDVSNIYEKAGYYWDYVYDIGDPSDPNAQTHILFKKNDNVVAYRPNMPFTKPFHMYLYQWSDGEFKSVDNPKFNIAVGASENGSSRSICLTPYSD